MKTMLRRSFLRLTALAVPGSYLLAQESKAPKQATPVVVPAGQDREKQVRGIGVSSTAYKVLTAETGGAMFVLEQTNARKGGPPKHVHFSQDELFYVLEGEYVVEVGSEQVHLKAGDCVLGPRGVPHAWAFVGATTGRLLLTYSPAGRMEEFFNDREKLGIQKGAYSTGMENERMRPYGIENVGPPIKVS